MKYLSSHTTNHILNIDLLQENCLNDMDMLNSFLEKNFFFLDYFTIAMHSKKYNLCYLLFVYKILKNINDYDFYYNNYCDKTIKKYDKIIYNYHSDVLNKLKILTNTLNSFVKYKINNIYINVNKFDSHNFLTKLKNKNFYNLYRKNYKNNIKVNYHKDYKVFLNHFEKYKIESKFKKQEFQTTNVLTFDDFIYSDIDLDYLNGSLLIKQKKLEE